MTLLLKLRLKLLLHLRQLHNLVGIKLVWGLPRPAGSIQKGIETLVSVPFSLIFTKAFIIWLRY